MSYNPWPTGSTGTDASANAPAIPPVGGAPFTTGPYAGFVLTTLQAASAARSNIDVENTSGSTIVVVRDDGTAAVGSPPNNASVFPLAGGGSVGAQGGAWSSQTFKGRLQVYSPITTALTFTAALTAATSGTLNAPWSGSTGNVFLTFSTGAVQLASFTNGSTNVTWANPVTAGVYASAATARVTVMMD
jgi:hypothetical protein